MRDETLTKSLPVDVTAPSPAPVVVVGGGIAGLAAAFELHRAGIPFVLLEASDRFGGVIISERHDDFVIDGGPDSLLIQKPEGIALCRELGLGDRLMPTLKPRLSYILRDGQLHALPAASVLGVPTQLGPFIRTKLFTWPGKLRMGAEWFVPRRTDTADESIGAFMTRRFGQEATTYLAEPLLAGIHAGNVDQLSIGALFPRFTAAEREHGSLLRAFRQPTKSPPLADGAFRSLPGGLSELVGALVAALPPESLHLRSPVETLSRTATGYRVHAAGVEPMTARAVLLAAPAFAVGAMVRAIDPALAGMADGIPYASAGTVVLAYRRDQVSHSLRGSGFVVPRAEGLGITAGSWLSSKWPHRAPHGMVLMRAFVGGARDPHAIDKSDAELVRDSLNALTPLLGLSGAPLFSRVYRFVRANAQHNVGHGATMSAVERALDRHQGLFITGSGFRGVGIPDVVADARATARQVKTWLDESI